MFVVCIEFSLGVSLVLDGLGGPSGDWNCAVGVVCYAGCGAA